MIFFFKFVLVTLLELHFKALWEGGRWHVSISLLSEPSYVVSKTKLGKIVIDCMGEEFGNVHICILSMMILTENVEYLTLNVDIFDILIGFSQVCAGNICWTK